MFCMLRYPGNSELVNIAVRVYHLFDGWHTRDTAHGTTPHARDAKASTNNAILKKFWLILMLLIWRKKKKIEILSVRTSDG